MSSRLPWSNSVLVKAIQTTAAQSGIESVTSRGLLSKARTIRRSAPRQSIASSSSSSRLSIAPLTQSVSSRPFSITMTSQQANPEAASTQQESREGPLAMQECTPCRRGGAKMSVEDALVRLQMEGAPQLLETKALEACGWRINEAIPGEHALSKEYKFKNFRKALAFTNGVGRIAEEQKHHPRLTTEWGKVTVDWWTHSVGGLHDNDFIMAAKTDLLAADTFGSTLV